MPGAAGGQRRGARQAEPPRGRGRSMEGQRTDPHAREAEPPASVAATTAAAAGPPKARGGRVGGGVPRRAGPRSPCGRAGSSRRGRRPHGGSRGNRGDTGPLGTGPVSRRRGRTLTRTGARPRERIASREGPPDVGAGGRRALACAPAWRAPVTAPAGRRNREAPLECAEPRRHPPGGQRRLLPARSPRAAGSDARAFRGVAPPPAARRRAGEPRLRFEAPEDRRSNHPPPNQEAGGARGRAKGTASPSAGWRGAAVAPPAGGESMDAAASPPPKDRLPPGRAGRRRRGCAVCGREVRRRHRPRPSRSPPAWPESGAWTRRGWRKGGRRVVRIPRRRAAGLPPKALRRPAELRKGEEIRASRGPRGQVGGHSVASPQHCSQKTPRGRRNRRFAIEAGAAVSMFGPTGADRSPRVGGRTSGSRHKPTNRFVQRSQPTRTSPVSGSESGSCQDEMMEIQR